jgi:phage terminase large subunit-like protein
VITSDLALRARAELALRQREATRTLAPPESFRGWIRRVLPQFTLYPHVELMIETAQRVVDGEITRLLVSAPPRYFKSLIWARLLPAYYLATRPMDWVAVVSSSATLSEIMSGDAREFYRGSGSIFRSDSQDKALWRTPRGGGMWARGIGGWALGVGYNLGIVDDPFGKWEDAMRPSIQEGVEDYFWKTFMGRREVASDRPAAIVVNHQALAEGDLRGRILRREMDAKLPPEGWHVLNLPAIKAPRRDPFPPSVHVIPDIAHWDGPSKPARPRQDGEPLCPQLQDQDIEGLRRLERMDSILFAATHQQEPLPDFGGGLFERWWWPEMGDPVLIQEMWELGFTLNDVLKELTRRKQIPEMIREARAWDFAATEGAGDFTASVRGGITESRKVLYTDAWDHQIHASKLKSKIVETAHRDGQGVEVILPAEPAAAGKILISDLQVELENLGFVVIVVPTSGSKWVRAVPHAGAAQWTETGKEGRCFILPGPWNRRWTEQHHRFDGVSKPMDLVDATSELFSELDGSSFLTSAVR